MILPFDDEDDELWASAMIGGRAMGRCVGVALVYVGQKTGE